MKISKSLCSILAAAVGALFAQPAPAATGDIEAAFGASNISAVTGNGGLTAGISREGAVSVLSWPSPSYTDHVHYIAENGENPREKPRMGALEGFGIYSGIAVKWSGNETVDTTFFPDQNWTWNVTYEGDNNSIIVTEYVDDDRGITVTQTDFIPEDSDTLIRRYKVELDDSQVDEAWLIGYSNITSNMSIVPQIPVADFLIEHYNDFLALWDESSQSIVHFHPGDTGVVEDVFGLLNVPERDFGPVGELLTNSSITESDIADAVSTLDDDYGEGAYVRIGTSPAPDQHQIGFDRTDTCSFLDTLGDNISDVLGGGAENPLPLDPSTLDLLRCGDFQPVQTVVEDEGWQYTADDALEDARDGELSGSSVAGAQVNTALRTPLTFEGGTAEATMYYAFGKTDAEASQTLDEIMGRDVATVQSATKSVHESFVADLNIPDDFNAGLTRFSKRTFLNLRVGTDADNGAIVASISRQAPYFLDWPRDGVFFNQALQLAGLEDLVTQRQYWYADRMRDQREDPVVLINTPLPGWPGCQSCNEFPPNSWEMNYYADGTVGGNIRLEIDNTGLLIWGFVAHIGYLPEDERQQYAQQIWPTIEDATDFVADWKDDETGLVFPANEDDNAEYTQGLQGAVTVFGALRAASMLADYLGEDEAKDRWTDRALELREATLEHMYTEEDGFLGRPEGSRSLGGRFAWMSWPARMFPWDDERVQSQLEDAMDAQMVKVRGETEGGAYTTKVAISAALAGESQEIRDEALEMARILATEVASEQTQQLGEVFLNIDNDGDGVADERVNAVSTPHLWAATLVYLTAMAVHEPEAFDPYQEILPRNVALDGPAPDGGGDASDASDAGDDLTNSGGSSDGGCSTVPATGGLPVMLALVAIAGLAVRRRPKVH
jgi:MYXO-CTERM domain-containing protein